MGQQEGPRQPIPHRADSILAQSTQGKPFEQLLTYQSAVERFTATLGEMRAGYGGGVVIDIKNSTKAREQLIYNTMLSKIKLGTNNLIVQGLRLGGAIADAARAEAIPFAEAYERERVDVEAMAGELVPGQLSSDVEASINTYIGEVRNRPNTQPGLQYALSLLAEQRQREAAGSVQDIPDTAAGPRRGRTHAEATAASKLVYQERHRERVGGFRQIMLALDNPNAVDTISLPEFADLVDRTAHSTARVQTKQGEVTDETIMMKWENAKRFVTRPENGTLSRMIHRLREGDAMLDVEQAFIGDIKAYVNRRDGRTLTDEEALQEFRTVLFPAWAKQKEAERADARNEKTEAELAAEAEALLEELDAEHVALTGEVTAFQAASAAGGTSQGEDEYVSVPPPSGNTPTEGPIPADTAPQPSAASTVGQPPAPEPEPVQQKNWQIEQYDPDVRQKLDEYITSILSAFPTALDTDAISYSELIGAYTGKHILAFQGIDAKTVATAGETNIMPFVAKHAKDAAYTLAEVAKLMYWVKNKRNTSIPFSKRTLKDLVGLAEENIEERKPKKK